MSESPEANSPLPPPAIHVRNTRIRSQKPTGTYECSLTADLVATFGSEAHGIQVLEESPSADLPIHLDVGMAYKGDHHFFYCHKSVGGDTLRAIVQEFNGHTQSEGTYPLDIDLGTASLTPDKLPPQLNVSNRDWIFCVWGRFWITKDGVDEPIRIDIRWDTHFDYQTVHTTSLAQDWGNTAPVG